MIDGGYFVRQIVARPREMVAPGVREICSVSECMSSGPDEWIQRWLHNGWGWFNRVPDALGVVPPGQESVYRLFAYRMHRVVFTAAAASRSRCRTMCSRSPSAPTSAVWASTVPADP